jgi:hypothetical protein
MFGIGIICYKILNIEGTNNIGDWYQTAASMYMWWKYFNYKTTFYDFLKECIETQTINSYPIFWLYRDHMSECDPRGHKIVTICNGWWLGQHTIGMFDFPLPSFIIPIYTSFHLAFNQLLTPTNIEHFRLHQPIGCRDASTHESMTRAGIDSFISGCMTMAVNLRDPQLGFHKKLNYTDNHVFIDVPINFTSGDKREIAYITQEGHYHIDPKWIIYSVQHLYNLLDTYCVTTGRLHIWLPLICNDTNVVLLNRYCKPYQITDIDHVTPNNDRFRGLFSLSIEERAVMKQQLITDCHLRINTIFSEKNQ